MVVPFQHELLIGHGVSEKSSVHDKGKTGVLGQHSNIIQASYK